ncbi:MAG TPA: hypothetical protein VL326_23445 [Kofleriaceae bacterium]|jgi:hypothetical protein|nr:hypothetical protein [Kofleriaceae bacterium]
MRWSAVAVFALVVGCLPNAPTDDDSSEDPNAHQPGPEIDGTYLDTSVGACVGAVGGAIRCSGTTCDAIEDATTCAAAPGCFVALNADATFRKCFPVDTRATATAPCADLDATLCATRENCTAVYQGQSIFGSFVNCQDET